MARKDPKDPKDRKEVAQRFHGLQKQLANNPKLEQAIQETAEDANARKQAEADPKGYLQSRGIDLPDDAEVTVEEGSWCWRVCVLWWCWWVCVDISWG
jgi:phosphoketolase